MSTQKYQNKLSELFLIFLLLFSVISKADDDSGAVEGNADGDILTTIENNTEENQSNPKPATPEESISRYQLPLLELGHKLKQAEEEYTEIFDSKELTEILAIEVYQKGLNTEMDFSRDHSTMLKNFTKLNSYSNKLLLFLSSFKRIHEEAIILKGRVGTVEPGEVVTGESGNFFEVLEKIIIKSQQLSYATQESLELINTKREKINSTLIEQVHHYNLRNNYRQWISLGWAAAFILLIVFSSYLLKKETIVLPKESTFQTIALVFILLALVLFGITDVISENGITGILAALAGYVLGKSSNGEISDERLETIINAVKK